MYNLLRISSICSGKKFSNHCRNRLANVGDLPLVEIMRIMDGPVAMLPCVSLNYYQSCEECDEKSCAIKGMFESIIDKTLDILGNTSLYDLNQRS